MRCACASSRRLFHSFRRLRTHLALGIALNDERPMLMSQPLSCNTFGVPFRHALKMSVAWFCSMLCSSFLVTYTYIWHCIKGRHDAMVPSKHTLCAIFQSVPPASPSGDGQINWSLQTDPLLDPLRPRPSPDAARKDLVFLMTSFIHSLSLS